MAQTRLAFLTTVLIIDLAATVLIRTVTRQPMAVIVTLAFFRPVVLFVAFGAVLLLTTLSGPPTTARCAGACVLFYLLFPFCLWTLKQGQESAADVYSALYANAELFALMCLPFLLASGLGLYVASFRHRLKPETNP